MTHENTQTTLQDELKQFYGTEYWYKHALGFIYTDGIKYLAEHAKAYWLLDVVGSVQHLTRLKNNDFQLWRLRKNQDDNTCIIDVWTDTPGKSELLYRQDIPYTDFPLEHFEFYFQNNTMLLKSEY